MAIDNYEDLKAAIVRFNGGDDLVQTLDDAIDITESRIYANPTEPLRLRSMETRSTAALDTSSRFLALPDGFLKMRRLQVETNGGNCDVRYFTPEQLSVANTGGIPRFFTVTSQLEFDRVPDSTYTIEMQFFARPTPISEDNPTNDVLTNYPDIYLFGSLWVVNQYAAEEEKAEYYYGKFIESISGANIQDRRGRYGAAPIMRTETATP